MKASSDASAAIFLPGMTIFEALWSFRNDLLTMVGAGVAHHFATASRHCSDDGSVAWAIIYVGPST